MTSPLRDRRIAVVGATGAVGGEALSILAERGVPASRVSAFGSPASVGRQVPYGTEHLDVLGVERLVAKSFDLALLAIESEHARMLAPLLVQRGARVVDNSSAYRADAKVPLVVPEVNGDPLEDGPSIVANPNCSTILLSLLLAPLQRTFGIETAVVSTYQAVSGAGRAGLEELEQQVRAELAGEPVQPEVFPEPIAFNVFSHESRIDPATGQNGEERKMVSEMERLLGEEIDLVPTCVRVPVRRAHSQSVFVKFRRPAMADAVRGALAGQQGLELQGEEPRSAMPTPLRASGRDEVLVGRIRTAHAGPEESAEWCFWLSGDQLRKGAALNAVQIAERLARLDAQ